MILDKKVTDFSWVKVIESKLNPIKRVVYSEWEKTFDSVVFLDESDNSLTICTSSQIGCAERCAFCATGDQKLFMNLSRENITKQIITWIWLFDNISSKSLFVIMEGMGEASHNAANVFDGFAEAYEKIADKFDRIVFRISTVGEIRLIPKYKEFVERNRKIMQKVDFQFQLSLHNSLDTERSELIPVNSKNYPLSVVLSEFSGLATYLNTEFRCNYLLLNYPDWRNNYSDAHIRRLVELMTSISGQVKLTRYSETFKGFSSPNDEVYNKVAQYLSESWVSVKIRWLLGSDIMAACWMILYKNVSESTNGKYAKVMKN
jgi:23S rRNA (adenine2503-C2)-methyltransferase